MDERSQKKTFVYRILSKRPWLYALFWLAVCLVFCAILFDKVVMPVVAREYAEELPVPALEGLDSAKAVAAATEAGFQIAFSQEREYSNRYDIGLVMRQNPLADRNSKPGRTIRVTLSDGLHQFTVPDLFDKNGEEAVREIEKAGLNVGLTFTTPHPNLSKGKVVRTNPSEGSLVHQGDTVDIFLSSGAKGQKISLPNVSHVRLAIAKQNLREAGFIVGKVTVRKKAGTASGLVLSQDPAAETLLSAGARINLVVSE